MRRLVLLAEAALALASCSQSNMTEPAQSGNLNDTSTSAAVSTGPDSEAPSPEPAAKSIANDPAAREPPQVAIPARFHGTYAGSLAHCDNPSHGLISVEAKAIRFFESTGEVRDVRAEGPYAAVTVFEQYGDGPGGTYAFYMRLLPGGGLRYRYDDNDRLTWVRCPQRTGSIPTWR